MAIDKQVRFFRADPRPLDIDRAATAVGKANRAEQEMPLSAGRTIVGRRLRARQYDAGVHVVLYQVETEDLPFLRDPRTREFRPLEEILASGVELAQPTYYGFFPADIMAMVYNHKGPKEAALGSFLFFLDNGVNHTFLPIVRDDVLQAIRDAAGVRLFNIRAQTDQLVRLSDIESLAGLGDVARRLPSGSVEIIVRARTDDQKRSLGRVVARIGSRLGTANHRAAVEKATVELAELDEVSGAAALNMLESKLAVSHRIATVPGHRTYLDEASARDGLEEAYGSVGELIDGGS